MLPYPTSWPKPNKLKPYTLATRITEEHKIALFNREITTRDLAKIYDVHEKYVSTIFPGKMPVGKKKELIRARKLYRLDLCKKIEAQVLSIRQAAEQAHASYSAIQRLYKRYRNEQLIHS